MSRTSSVPAGAERRAADRVDVTWDVDCRAEDTFLYACITNVSELGIFVSTNEPLEPGTAVLLKFAPHGVHPEFELRGVVQWVNPIKLLANRNPGMGVTFVDITGEDRERLVDVIHTIAYLRDSRN